MQSAITIPDWPCAHGGPAGRGRIRCSPEDFIVKERLGFELSGQGEHVFVEIQKRSQNTEYIARELARFFSVSLRDVSYAGMKDRHALTTQWFSVRLPVKEEPDWSGFATDDIQVLQSIRHRKKLKRGSLSGNDFILTIRDWKGDVERLIKILTRIQAEGVPNYFGSQRFGREGRNVDKALGMFRGARLKRHQRSLYLSAARSFLFNEILASRIETGSWNQALTGDTFIFDRSGAYFRSEQPDATILQRLEAGEIHPTGVLWGQGTNAISAQALEIEEQILQRYPDLAQGLVNTAVVIDRRALRVNIDNLRWQFIGPSVLRLAFFLPAGSYATSVLREIMTLNEG